VTNHPQVGKAYHLDPDDMLPPEARRAVEAAFLRVLERRYPGTVWTIQEYQQAAA
jgi:hypothetical protein